jgi:hypothetical protein
VIQGVTSEIVQLALSEQHVTQKNETIEINPEIVSPEIIELSQPQVVAHESAHANEKQNVLEEAIETTLVNNAEESMEVAISIGESRKESAESLVENNCETEIEHYVGLENARIAGEEASSVSSSATPNEIAKEIEKPCEVETVTNIEEKKLNNSTPVLPAVLSAAISSSPTPTPNSPSTPTRLARRLSISGSEPICPHCDAKIYFQELKTSDHKTGQRFHAKCLPLFQEKLKREEKARLMQHQNETKFASSTNMSGENSPVGNPSHALVRPHRSASTNSIPKKITSQTSNANASDPVIGVNEPPRGHLLSFRSAFCETGSTTAVKTTPQKVSAIERAEEKNSNAEKPVPTTVSATVTGGFRSTLLSSPFVSTTATQPESAPSKPPFSNAPLSATPSRASSSRASFQRQQSLCSKPIYPSEMSQSTKDGKKYHNNCYNAFLKACSNLSRSASTAGLKSSSLEVQCEVVSVDEQGKSVSTWQALVPAPSCVTLDEQQHSLRKENIASTKSSTVTVQSTTSATTDAKLDVSTLENSSISNSAQEPSHSSPTHVTRVKRSQSANSPLPSPMKLKPIVMSSDSTSESSEKKCDGNHEASPTSKNVNRNSVLLASTPSSKKSFYSFHFVNEEKIQRNFVNESDRIGEIVLKLLKKRNCALDDYDVVDFEGM